MRVPENRSCNIANLFLIISKYIISNFSSLSFFLSRGINAQIFINFYKVTLRIIKRGLYPTVIKYRVLFFPLLGRISTDCRVRCLANLASPDSRNESELRVISK